MIAYSTPRRVTLVVEPRCPPMTASDHRVVSMAWRTMDGSDGPRVRSPSPVHDTFRCKKMVKVPFCVVGSRKFFSNFCEAGTIQSDRTCAGCAQCQCGQWGARATCCG